MIVKVVVRGHAAHISSSPSDPNRVVMTAPASRVRPRFPRSADPAAELVGYFVATEASTKNVTTHESIPLDVIELGERVPAPEKQW